MRTCCRWFQSVQISAHLPAAAWGHFYSSATAAPRGGRCCGKANLCCLLREGALSRSWSNQCRVVQSWEQFSVTDISVPFPTQVFCWEQNIARNPSPPPPPLSSPPRRCCLPTPRQAAETAAPRQIGAVSRAKLLLPLQLPPQHDSPAPTWPTVQRKQVTELSPSPGGHPATLAPPVGQHWCPFLLPGKLGLLFVRTSWFQGQVWWYLSGLKCSEGI